MLQSILVIRGVFVAIPFVTTRLVSKFGDFVVRRECCCCFLEDDWHVPVLFHKTNKQANKKKALYVSSEFQRYPRGNNITKQQSKKEKEKTDALLESIIKPTTNQTTDRPTTSTSTTHTTKRTFYETIDFVHVTQIIRWRSTFHDAINDGFGKNRRRCGFVKMRLEVFLAQYHGPSCRRRRYCAGPRWQRWDKGSRKVCRTCQDKRQKKKCFGEHGGGLFVIVEESRRMCRQN